MIINIKRKNKVDKLKNVTLKCDGQFIMTQNSRLFNQGLRIKSLIVAPMSPRPWLKYVTILTITRTFYHLNVMI